MVEVGNENGTRNFPARYRLVHSALKQHYPDIQYVADYSFPRFMGEETSDIQDKVELSGTRIRCYLDGKLVHDETARTPERFFALAGRDDSGHHLLLKVINAGAEPVNAQLQFQNAGRIARDAELTLLTSSKPTDNNSLENSAAVGPMTSKIQFDPANCVREFPPYSFSLLRLETN